MSALFDAEDPRAWLAEVLGERQLSQKVLAAAIGVSPSQLNNHLSRRRRLNLSKEEALIAALGLNEAEARQYRALVALDRAPSNRARERALAAVQAGRRRARGEQGVRTALDAPLALEAAVLRELAGVAGYRPEADWIATTLDPPRMPREVVAWANTLGACGLGSRLRGGRSAPAPALHLRVEGSPGDHEAALFGAARAAALAALDRVPQEDRHFGLLFQAIPAAVLPEVREALAWMADRVLARCDAGLSAQRPARKVYGLLSQLLPLTRPLHAVPPARTRLLPETDEPPPWRPGDPEPSLYASLDYRRYLADWRAHRALTLEQVAMKLRRHLPAGEALARQQIHAILHREAHIRPEHTEAWARALELSVGDSRYLGAVVAWHLAEDSVERARCWAELLPYQQMGLGWRLSRYSEAFMRSALPPTLLELARHPAFTDDVAWIQDLLLRPASAEELRDTVVLLEDLRFLSWTAAGRLVPAMGTLHTEDAALTRDASRALYRDVAALGETACAADPAATLDLLIQAAPDAVLADLCADLEETRLHIQGLVDAALEGRSEGGPQVPDRVWLLAIQWFPLSRPSARRA